MTVIEKYYEQVLDKWKEHKGKGSVVVVKPFKIEELIVKTVLKVLEKTPDSKVLIVVDGYNTRLSLNNIFSKQLGDISRIKILSEDYITCNHYFSYDLGILYMAPKYHMTISTLTLRCKFILHITNKYDNDLQQVYKVLPELKTNINSNNAKDSISLTPVEEHRCGVELDEADKTTYDECTNFINDSMVVIGDFRNIEKIKNGDVKLGLSAAEVRYMIAQDNGWSEHLDMTIPFNKQIDTIYNPNILLERATRTYDIIHKRRNLLIDNKSKLDKIVEIVNNHPNNRIVIISKRAEFAAIITKHINDNTNYLCLDVHDCLDKEMDLDMFGRPVLYKSGEHKGEIKYIGATAISNRNIKRYKNNQANIISTTQTKLNGLQFDCDLWIITSPVCDTIMLLRNRCICDFNTNPALIYKIYCKNTVEEKKLSNEQINSFHSVVTDNEKNLTYDENSGDIIL